MNGWGQWLIVQGKYNYHNDLSGNGSMHAMGTSECPLTINRWSAADYIIVVVDLQLVSEWGVWKILLWTLKIKITKFNLMSSIFQRWQVGYSSNVWYSWSWLSQKFIFLTNFIKCTYVLSSEIKCLLSRFQQNILEIQWKLLKIWNQHLKLPLGS